MTDTAPAAALLLAPMTDTEFASFMATAVPAYAQAKVASGQWAADDALERAQREFDGLLPQGPLTPEHQLFTLRDGEGRSVGTLWFAQLPRGSERMAYVYDIAIHPELRRQGWARRALVALESEARRRGLSSIVLHVFGHNTGARALYEQLGFEATNIVMAKPVANA